MKLGAKLDFAFNLEASTDLESRTITGTAVPYGQTGYPGGGFGVVQFAAGSIEIPSKVHVLMQHDHDRPIGIASEFEDTDSALMVKMKIAATSRGDEALLEAAEGLRDGISVGVIVNDFAKQDDGSVTITAATLMEVSLVTFPAFDSARVASVAASAAEEIEEASEDSASDETIEESTVEETTTVAEATTPSVPLAASVREAFPYRKGGEFSFFADMLTAKDSTESAARFNQATKMLQAAQVSSDVSEIIPEQYRPDLYVAELGVTTPLLDAFQSFGLADARPFRLPKFGSATGMIDDHVEGTNPTDGEMAFDDQLVTPSGVSGQYTISREAILGSTPGIDAIIMNAIMQAVARKREEDFAAILLAGATAGTAVAEETATAGFLGNILDYEDARLSDPSLAFAGSDLFAALSLETDTTGRPMNPFIGASNANGSLGSLARTLNVAGLGVNKAWALSGGGLLALPTDAASWWSGLQTWRWEEVAGPANIRFAAYGIQAGAVLRSSGVVKFAVTPAA